MRFVCCGEYALVFKINVSWVISSTSKQWTNLIVPQQMRGSLFIESPLGRISGMNNSIGEPGLLSRWRRQLSRGVNSVLVPTQQETTLSNRKQEIILMLVRISIDYPLHFFVIKYLTHSHLLEPMCKTKFSIFLQQTPRVRDCGWNWSSFRGFHLISQVSLAKLT